MGNDPEIAKRWRGAGEIFLWVIYFFWAAWVFVAFLPPKPEQTPFEAFMSRQLGGRSFGHDAVRPGTPEAKDLSEQMAAGAGGE
jgi:hypothetical protein